MNNNDAGSGSLSVVIVCLTWLFNSIAMATKDEMAFGLGVLVALSALIHYWVSIFKHFKNDKSK